MKKFWALVLVFALLALALSGCGASAAPAAGADDIAATLEVTISGDGCELVRLESPQGELEVRAGQVAALRTRPGDPIAVTCLRPWAPPGHAYFTAAPHGRLFDDAEAPAGLRSDPEENLRVIQRGAMLPARPVH